MKPRNTSSAADIILPDKLSDSEARVLSFDPSSWTDGDVTVTRARGETSRSGRWIERRKCRGMKGNGAGLVWGGGEERRNESEKRRKKKERKITLVVRNL